MSNYHPGIDTFQHPAYQPLKHRADWLAIAQTILVAVLYSVSISGYPIIGALTDLLGLPPQTLSIPFRLAVFAFSAAIVAIAASNFRLSRIQALMYFFCVMYLMRLLIDDFGSSLPGADTAWQLFGVAILMPMFALTLSGRYWNDQTIALLHTGVSLLALVLVLYLGLTFGEERGVLTEEAGRLSSESVNPITIGYLGANLLFGAFCFYDKNRSRLLLAFLVVILVLAIYAVTQAASKGPVVAILAVMLFYVLKGRLPAWIALLVALASIVYATALEMPVVARIGSIQDDYSTQNRFDMIQDTFEQIAGSPWFGSAYIELHSGFYPHNQFLEAAMAVGVPLGIVYLVLCGFGLYAILRTKVGDNLFLASCYIGALINSVFSGSLWGNITMWLSLTVILVLCDELVPATRERVAAER